MALQVTVTTRTSLPEARHAGSWPGGPVGECGQIDRRLVIISTGMQSSTLLTMYSQWRSTHRERPWLERTESCGRGFDSSRHTSEESVSRREKLRSAPDYLTLFLDWREWQWH